MFENIIFSSCIIIFKTYTFLYIFGKFPIECPDWRWNVVDFKIFLCIYTTKVLVIKPQRFENSEVLFCSNFFEKPQFFSIFGKFPIECADWRWSPIDLKIFLSIIDALGHVFYYRPNEFPKKVFFRPPYYTSKTILYYTFY